MGSCGEARTRSIAACFLHHHFTSFCQDYLEGAWKAIEREPVLEEQYLPEEATRRSVVGATGGLGAGFG